MTEVVELPLDGGDVVLVEVDATQAGQLKRVGRGDHVVRSASETLEDALRRVRPAVEAVLGGVRDLAQPPDRVALEFGIKVTAAAGVVVAQAATEAHFKVIVEWERRG